MHSFERVLQPLADAQHGVVTRRQLLAAGVTRKVIDGRIASERLCRLHRGVYLAGPGRPTWCAEMAAVLACGSGTGVSRLSAAALWSLASRDDAGESVQVLGTARLRRPGIRYHRTRSLPRADLTRRFGISVTTPVRTLLDLAREARSALLDRVLAEAIARRLVTPACLRRCLEQRSGAAGTPRLLALLDQGAGALPRSVLERRMLALVRKAGLPPPEVNARVGGMEVDFLWRREGLVVETDGYRFHASRAAARKDRERDTRLTLLGFRVIRLTWAEVTETPMAAVAIVAGALAGRGPDGG